MAPGWGVFCEEGAGTRTYTGRRLLSDMQIQICYCLPDSDPRSSIGDGVCSRCKLLTEQLSRWYRGRRAQPPSTNDDANKLLAVEGRYWKLSRAFTKNFAERLPRFIPPACVQCAGV